MRVSSRQLPDEIRDRLRNLPETGMGYQVGTVVLKDGRRFERVYVLNGEEIASVDGDMEIPFCPSEIEVFEITHDKRRRV